MHWTQGPCVYRLKILHNHTSRHKVLILSVKYKQDKLRGFSPAIRMFHQKYIHMVCPISGEIPGLMMEYGRELQATGTWWFVWIVDVGRE